MDVVILGHGAHGRDVAMVAEAAGFRVAQFLDDHLAHHESCSIDFRGHYLIGVNASWARAELDREDSPTAPLAAIALHPTAYIGEAIDLAPGDVLAAGVILANDVKLGRHVHIGAGSTLIRCRVGPYVTIAPGVHVGGDVKIGAGAFLGIGARVRDRVTIGAWATVGAGAVVLEDVPMGATVVGCPARPLEEGAHDARRTVR